MLCSCPLVAMTTEMGYNNISRLTSYPMTCSYYNVIKFVTLLTIATDCMFLIS